ncbi:MAG: hypothetical protein A2X36_08930 [Elusimicrobia bacterium GWA2_69_24]|nr:MAG: hypothetical protein A2X36_08930 [Elusimicrobia bacterium GWA2_69_24]HBL18053.1 hypothetical protein [Elusimicrobiota bacterium]
MRGEAPPEEAPPSEAALSAAASEEALSPLRQRLEELERRLGEMAAPPPMEMAPNDGAPPAPPPPEPPQAPTELAIFLQTRIDLMEKRLESAQQEALRANLLLKEREEAQRKAQSEVEDLFRNIREQQRASSYDGLLRQQLSASQARLRELESRLSLAELRMVPAEEILRCLETDEGRAELQRRIQEQTARLEASPAEPAPADPSGPVPPAPPPEGAGPASLPELSIVLGRVADLERRLEEAHRERDREREARRHWEETLLATLQQTRRQWQKAGGPELLVEAALETMVDSIKQRDALAEELGRAAASVRDEPPDSRTAPLLRARAAECRQRMEALQEKIDKQMAVVQAWVERNKGKGKG